MNLGWNGLHFSLIGLIQDLEGIEIGILSTIAFIQVRIPSNPVLHGSDVKAMPG